MVILKLNLRFHFFESLPHLITGAPPLSPGIGSLRQGSAAGNLNGNGNDRQSRAATARSVNQRFSANQARDVNNVQKHVHDRLDHVNPRRVMIDGFRFGDEKSTGPFAWQITTPMKWVS